MKNAPHLGGVGEQTREVERGESMYSCTGQKTLVQKGMGEAVGRGE